MARGEGEDLTVPEEFFEDDFKELFFIEMCPSNDGTSSNLKIEDMKRLVPAW